MKITRKCHDKKKGKALLIFNTETPAEISRRDAMRWPKYQRHFVAASDISAQFGGCECCLSCAPVVQACRDLCSPLQWLTSQQAPPRQQNNTQWLIHWFLSFYSLMNCVARPVNRLSRRGLPRRVGALRYLGCRIFRVSAWQRLPIEEIWRGAPARTHAAPTHLTFMKIFCKYTIKEA